MLKKLLTATLLTFLVLPAAGAFAQTGTITGTVTDSTSGNTLPGVNVRLVGTDYGTATGAQGTFEITGVPTGEYTLSATFVGYDNKSMTIDVDEGTNQVRLRMVPSVVELQDVVVTALGVEREQRSLGVSVEEVEGESLAQVPETNFLDALSGEVSGVNITSSGTMGGSSRIVLRGPNSISGNNQPLFVVDGVPINNENFSTLGQEYGGGGYDYGNAASMINPENIQSVSVLKGPAAAALYGSRGANGVIQITTKSGQGGQGIGVTVNTSAMASSIYGLPDYQNRYGGGGSSYFGTLDGDLVIDETLDETAQGLDLNADGEMGTISDQYVVQYGTDQSWGPRLDGRPVRQWYSWDDVNGLAGEATPWVANPGNVENFYKTGVEFNTTLAFSQATEDFDYRMSLANLTQTGVLPNQHRGRNHITANASADLGENLQADVAANYVNTDIDGLPITGYSGINVQFNHFGQRQIALGEDSYLRDYQRANGVHRNWNWASTRAAALGILPGQNSGLIYANNPYWGRYENFATSNTQRAYGKVRLAYDFTDALTLSAQTGTDYYLEHREERTAVGSSLGGNADAGDYSDDSYEVQETFGQARLDYNGQLSEDLSLTAFAATEYRYENRHENEGSAEGGLSSANVYTLENSVLRPAINDYFQEKAVYSLFGSANLGWRDLLYLNLTARNDWSSTLPDDSNSYFYPSVSSSFVFSSLPALSESDVISFGKIRLAYARVGSDTQPYRLDVTYPLGTPYGEAPVQSLPSQLPNSQLRPEVTTSWEVGTQLQFFNNRLGLDATYYTETTEDQILPVQISDASGYSTFVVNAGVVSNQGFELGLSATPVLTDAFQWDLSANWSKNVNEVEDLYRDVQAFNIGPSVFGPDVQARVGEPIGTFYGSDFVRDADGNKVISPDGTYLSSAPQVLGNYQPDWTAGLSTTLSYKRLSASVSFNGQKGGEVYSLSNTWGNYSGMFQQTVDDKVRQLGVIPTDAVYFPNGEPADGYSSASGQPFNQRVDAQSYFGNWYLGPRSMVVYDASYIKLREARIGYTLPQRWLGNTFVRNLTVSAIGRNLALLMKNTPNFDPSLVALSSTNLQGIEAGPAAPRRRYGISVRLNF